MCDLGPEGGEAGGYLVFEGAPEELTNGTKFHRKIFKGEVLRQRRIIAVKEWAVNGEGWRDVIQVEHRIRYTEKLPDSYREGFHPYTLIQSSSPFDLFYFLF